MVSLLLALIVAHAISFLILADERYGAIAAAQRDQVLARTVSIARILAETPVDLHQKVADAASTMQLRFTVAPESALDPSNPANRDNRFAKRLSRLLELGQKNVLVAVQEGSLWSRQERDDDDAPGRESGGDFDSEMRWMHDEEGESDHHGAMGWRGSHHVNMSNLGLSVRLADGAWLNAEYHVYAPSQGWATATFLTIGLAAVAVYLVTFMMLRRLTRPLKHLAAAADSLGRGEDVPPLDETGPTEVRQTTAAFNHMKDSLRRFVDDRTRMLAAISHDLRTPLTTLRLRAELLEDGEPKNRILETLDEMQRMTEATLAFAREDAAREETRAVDLSALIESIVVDLHDMGHAVTFANSVALPYRCRPFGLKRALRNLVENAVRYGEHATVSLSHDPEGGITILVEDDGPGIPVSAHDRVFEPFVRMEESRSHETGGIGLGLSIARTIIRAHGGDIFLSNRPKGGLAVRVALPADTATRRADN